MTATLFAIAALSTSSPDMEQTVSLLPEDHAPEPVELLVDAPQPPDYEDRNFVADMLAEMATPFEAEDEFTAVEVQELLIVHDEVDAGIVDDGLMPCVLQQLRDFADMMDGLFAEFTQALVAPQIEYSHPCVPDLVRYDCDDAACLMARGGELSIQCAVMLLRQHKEAEEMAPLLIVQDVVDVVDVVNVEDEEPCDHHNGMESYSAGPDMVISVEDEAFGFHSEQPVQMQAQMMGPLGMAGVHHEGIESGDHHQQHHHQGPHGHRGPQGQPRAQEGMHMHFMPLMLVLGAGYLLGRACRKGRAEERVVFLEPLQAAPQTALAVKDAKDYNML